MGEYFLLKKQMSGPLQETLCFLSFLYILWAWIFSTKQQSHLKKKSAQVDHFFSYVQNVVSVFSFTGFGKGFFISGKKKFKSNLKMSRKTFLSTLGFLSALVALNEICTTML